MLSPAIICYFDFKITVENNLYEMVGKILKMLWDFITGNKWYVATAVKKSPMCIFS